MRLAAVLHQIAHDAGCALLTQGTGSARFCTDQYNRIHARLAELDPDLTAVFGPLPHDADAGQVRIVARALAASIREKVKARRNNVRAGCMAFFLPYGSLKFDLC